MQNTKTYAEAAPFLATGADGSANDGARSLFRHRRTGWIYSASKRRTLSGSRTKKQIGNGVSGWWLDLAEPEKHPAGMMHNLKDYGVARPMAADEVHNVYGHYFSKMFFEKYSSDVSDQRLFLLNRSGFAGSQRYGRVALDG